jgi:hypothetical protein
MPCMRVYKVAYGRTSRRSAVSAATGACSHCKAAAIHLRTIAYTGAKR